MLDAMREFGAYRVDYLNFGSKLDHLAFGFYLRAEISGMDQYSRDAKHQLYTGLAIIKHKCQMAHLAAVYLDVNSLENVARPAYLQMKQDMMNGMFRRIFVLDQSALMGTLATDEDLLRLFVQTGGFECFTCRSGEMVPLVFARVLEPVAV